MPELADEPRFRTNEARVHHRADLESLIERRFGEYSVAEITDRLAASGIPTGDVNDLRRLVEHPQLAIRDRWFETDSPGGPIRALLPPFCLTGQSSGVRGVPSLGEHTAEVLAELRHS